MDAHVGRHIFAECIQKLLLERGQRTVVMVTHAMQYVHSMDSVTLLEEGRVVVQGPPQQVRAAADRRRHADGGPAELLAQSSPASGR